MTDEQVDAICEAMKYAIAHCLGPAKEDFSLAAGVNRIADALGDVAEALGRLADNLGDEGQLERIADNLGDNGVFGTLERISAHVDRIAEVLEDKEEP